MFNSLTPCNSLVLCKRQLCKKIDLTYLVLHKKHQFKLISFVPVLEGLYASKGLYSTIFCKASCALCMYYSFYSAVVSICFPEGRFWLKNCISAQSQSVVGLEHLLLSQLLFERKIGKIFERGNRIQRKQILSALLP